MAASLLRVTKIWSLDRQNVAIGCYDERGFQKMAAFVVEERLPQNSKISVFRTGGVCAVDVNAMATGTSGLGL